MLKKPLIAGNWKLNKTPQEAQSFFKELLDKSEAKTIPHLAFFPPAIDLFVAKEMLPSNAYWGGQNIYSELSGAFTGENSIESLKDLGANMCLVGHSERRTLFNETDDSIAKKVRLIQELDIIPIICVGESLVQRESNKTQAVICDQVEKALKQIDIKKEFVIAYEPVWAIGTGKVATPDMAEEAHGFIKEKLEKVTSKDVADKALILYGGSVKPENAAELYSKPSVDGFLVGGASLKVDSFLGIFENTQIVN